MPMSWLGVPHGKVSWDSTDTLAFQGSTMPMPWLGVPPWQSILGFHGYSGIPGIYNAHVMARGTHIWQSILGFHGYSGIPGIYNAHVMARDTIPRILWHSRDLAAHGMARGTPMAKYPGIPRILWHSRDLQCPCHG